MTRIKKKGSRSSQAGQQQQKDERRNGGRVGKGSSSYFYTYSNPTIVSKCFVQATPTTNLNNQRKVKDDDEETDVDGR